MKAPRATATCLLLAILLPGCSFPGAGPDDGLAGAAPAWAEALFAAPPPGDLAGRLDALQARLAAEPLDPDAPDNAGFLANHSVPAALGRAQRDGAAGLHRGRLEALVDAAVTIGLHRVTKDDPDATCPGWFPAEQVRARGLALLQGAQSPEGGATPGLAEAQVLFGARIGLATALSSYDDCRDALHRRGLLLSIDVLGLSLHEGAPAPRPLAPPALNESTWPRHEELPLEMRRSYDDARNAAPFCRENALAPCLVLAAIAERRAARMAEAFAATTDAPDYKERVQALDEAARATLPGEKAREMAEYRGRTVETRRMGAAFAAAAGPEAADLDACFFGRGGPCPVTSG